MELNLNFVIKNVDGEDLMENGNSMTLARALANNLMMSKQGDPVKVWDWCLILAKTGILDVDRSDWQFLEKFVRDAEISNLLKAQLLGRFIKTP